MSAALCDGIVRSFAEILARTTNWHPIFRRMIGNLLTSGYTVAREAHSILSAGWTSTKLSDHDERLGVK